MSDTNRRIQELDDFIRSQDLRPGNSRLSWTAIDGVCVVRFLDRNILDEANIQQISDELCRYACSQWAPMLILSFEDVDHLSSAAFGTLISINNRIREHGGMIALTNIALQIYEVFIITKLNRLFRIYETAAEALEALRPFAGRLTRRSSPSKLYRDVASLIRAMWNPRLETSIKQQLEELSRKYGSLASETAVGGTVQQRDVTQAVIDLKMSRELGRPCAVEEIIGYVSDAIHSLEEQGE